MFMHQQHAARLQIPAPFGQKRNISMSQSKNSAEIIKTTNHCRSYISNCIEDSFFFCICSYALSSSATQTTWSACKLNPIEELTFIAALNDSVRVDQL